MLDFCWFKFLNSLKIYFFIPKRTECYYGLSLFLFDFFQLYSSGTLRWTAGFLFLFLIFINNKLWSSYCLSKRIHFHEKSLDPILDVLSALFILAFRDTGF